MQIGAMNHPAREPIEEIRMFSSMGLEFVDLTIEPPCAAAWRVDPKEIRRVLDDLGMGVVGHTAFYLPIASPFDSMRCAAVDELKRSVDIFAAVGSKWMNFHPDPRAFFHERPFVIKQNLISVQEIIEHGRQQGVGIMVENIPAGFNSASSLGELLDPLPDLGLHLDIGHCNLQVSKNTSEEILARYGTRLKHLHLHDNNGGNADLHLPLGVGRIDFRHEIPVVKAAGYDGTITLEVFAEDKHYLEYSRDVLRRLWAGC
jgi:sugar phosphate isomerase/epimerase